MHLLEPLSDREGWPMTGRCPVERTMKIIGSRNAMLTMREAFYGTRRYDDFAARVGMSAATTASNLRTLTDAGLLERRPYRDEGSRTRDEYVLTQAGTDLMPVVLALHAWGIRYASDPPPIELTHVDCGEPVEIHVTCRAGHRLSADDIAAHIAKPSGA
ncbi:winged helix-turn-helix transcriptional regulator [Streptomyces sp. NPDC059766]|uniref:winged helix-turn-helix transcriptional regulator n=1 Tax=Streptomyces sp. NPDC059766 TaxID=3346940 RepID=UPI00364E2151